MRVAVLSDIHSNIVALDAVLSDAGDVDAIWHLGDVVGYGPQPDAVVARLGERDATGVRGNHDAAAVGGPEIDWFNPEARAAAEVDPRHHVRRRPARGSAPSRSDASWMTSCSSMAAHVTPCGSTSPTVPSAEDNIAVQETQHALHGHTHVPAAWTATPIVSR